MQFEPDPATESVCAGSCISLNGCYSLHSSAGCKRYMFAMLLRSAGLFAQSRLYVLEWFQVHEGLSDLLNGPEGEALFAPQPATKPESGAAPETSTLHTRCEEAV